MTSTPEQKREAWVSLMESLQRSLITTRENAKAMVVMTDLSVFTVPEVRARAEGRLKEWDATQWAAQRILRALLKLDPPVVPVDDALGQGDILEALSTSGENPGDERQPRCATCRGSGWTGARHDNGTAVGHYHCPCGAPCAVDRAEGCSGARARGTRT